MDIDDDKILFLKKKIIVMHKKKFFFSAYFVDMFGSDVSNLNKLVLTLVQSFSFTFFSSSFGTIEALGFLDGLFSFLLEAVGVEAGDCFNSKNFFKVI